MSRQHLDHYHYGKLVKEGTTVGGFDVTAHSSGLDLGEAEGYQRSVSFGSYDMVQGLGGLQHGYGLLKHDERIYLFAHVRPGPVRDRGHIYPDYHVIVVRREVVSHLAGNLSPLAEFDRGLQAPEIRPGTPPLQRLSLHHAQSLSTYQESECLEFLYEAVGSSGYLIEQLLAALIAGSPVAVIDAPAEPKWRLNFTQALLLTLPHPFRHCLTFATEVFYSEQCRALLKFLYQDPYSRSAESDTRLSWKDRSLSPVAGSHRYAEFIAANWHRGPEWLVETLRKWQQESASVAAKPATVSEALRELAEKMEFRQQVEEGTVTPESLARAVETGSELTGTEIREFSLLLLDMSVNSNQPDLMRSVAKRGITRRLAGDLRESMIQLVRQGFGRVVLELLGDWLRSPLVSRIDSSYWAQTLQEVALAHLNHLVQHGGEDDILRFVAEVRQSTEGFELMDLWPNLIAALKPAGREYPKIAKELISLTALHQPDQLAALLTNRQVRELWPDDLRTIATDISSARARAEPARATLVEASRSLMTCPDLVFVKLASLAIEKGRFYLMDAEAWRKLQTLLAQGEEYVDQAGKLSAALDDQRWTSSLSDEEALLALMNLRLALGQQEEAVSLLYHMQPESFEEQAKFAERVSLFLRQQAFLTTRQAAARLLDEMRRSSFAHRVVGQAYLGVLDRFNWEVGEATIGLADLLDTDRTVRLDEEHELHLLGQLARIEGGDVRLTQAALRRSLDAALDKPQWTHRVNTLARIAEQLGETSDMRAQMRSYIRVYAQELSSVRDLQRFHEELGKHRVLCPEVEVTSALLTVGLILGSQNLREFADELVTLNKLLGRLQHAFGPLNGKKGPPEIDWKTFEETLLSQLGELTKEQRTILGSSCLYLASRISDLGDARTKGGRFTDKSKIDRGFELGLETPKSAVDALKWLGGLFHGRHQSGSRQP